MALASPAARGAIIIKDGAALTDGNANMNWHGIDQVGLPIVAIYDVAAVWRDANLANRQLAITYGGDHALDANQADATITAINLANHNLGTLTVSQNLSIGSIVPDARGAGVAGRLPIDISVGCTRNFNWYSSCCG